MIGEKELLYRGGSASFDSVDPDGTVDDQVQDTLSGINIDFTLIPLVNYGIGGENSRNNTAFFVAWVTGEQVITVLVSVMTTSRSFALTTHIK